MSDNMLHVSIKDIQSESILGMIEELGQVKGCNHGADPSITLFCFLQLCQRDVVRDKKERIDAARFYVGSALKTKVEKLDDDLYYLTEDLCSHFRVFGHEQVLNKTLYVFLNDIFNPKSKLRKLPPLQL